MEGCLGGPKGEHCPRVLINLGVPESRAGRNVALAGLAGVLVSSCVVLYYDAVVLGRPGEGGCEENKVVGGARRKVVSRMRPDEEVAGHSEVSGDPKRQVKHKRRP